MKGDEMEGKGEMDGEMKEEERKRKGEIDGEKGRGKEGEIWRKVRKEEREKEGR